jgi:dihydroflavonol-4-reductase
MAGMMEKQAKKSGKRPLMTTFSVYNLARNNEFDSEKAKRELGYTTRSYAETIRDEVHWLKAAGKIA